MSCENCDGCPCEKATAQAVNVAWPKPKVAEESMREALNRVYNPTVEDTEDEQED